MNSRRSIDSSYSYFLTIVVLITTAFGYRDYTVTLETFDCIPKNNFLKSITCNIDKKSGFLRAYAEVQGEVDNVLLNTSGNFTLPNMNTKEFFKYNGIKICDIFNEPVLNPILRLIKVHLEKYSNLPEKCPIPSNYVFRMSNVTLDAEKLPLYLPECRFTIAFTLMNKHKPGVIVQINGRIKHKKARSKGRRTSKKS